MADWNLAQTGAASLESETAEVVGNEIKSGHETDFDLWFNRYLSCEKKASGYLGTTILAPKGNESNLRYVITRFKDRDSLLAWKRSEERIKLIEEVKSYSTPYYQHATGLETWFALPGVTAAPPPPRWKMSIVTFFAAYVISAIVFNLLNPFIASLPFLVNNLIITALLVISLTYFVMPRLTKLLRKWLYPGW